VHRRGVDGRARAGASHESLRLRARHGLPQARPVENLDEITKILDEQGFWAKFPPDGIVVESWYVLMGLGHVATLRVPPARLREFNRSIEVAAWKASRSEICATYDFKEVAKTARERALKK
jgi:hypothetical protein